MILQSEKTLGFTETRLRFTKKQDVRFYRARRLRDFYRRGYQILLSDRAVKFYRDKSMRFTERHKAVRFYRARRLGDFTGRHENLTSDKSTPFSRETKHRNFREKAF